MGFKPHLLPVTLVIATDLDALAQGVIQLLQAFTERFGGHHGLANGPGRELALGNEVAVAADRGGDLHVGRQAQAEVGGRLGRGQAATETLAQGRMAHGSGW